MSFSLKLKEALKPFHLLNHPFYQDWNEGKLSMETLQEYAKQYYHHVKAFPRYISATHAQCEDIQNRKILLENLMDEEGINATDHPELWARFSDGLGVPREELEASTPSDAIKNIISTFLSAGSSSYEEGLASLYAYEYQVPEVAESKIEGLEKHYDIHNKRTLSFFNVHKTADIHHRKECEDLLDKFDEASQDKAIAAATKSAQALWDFLTDVHPTSNCAQH